jgi:type II secretory pathway pseudopilin PulG
MKKNIIIGILTVLTLTSFVYAVYEDTVAQKLRIEAESAMEEAIKQNQLAKNNEMIAKVNEAEAIRQKQAAEEAIKNCQSKKK